MKQRFLLTIMLWLSLLGSTWAQSNALHFDGTNDYVVCPAINPTQFTVAAWVYPTTLGKDQAIISTLSESAATGMELHIGADNIPVLTIRSGSNWVDVKGTTAVAVSTWTHVAATCSGSMVYLYVNGKKDKGVTLTNGYSPSTRDMNLGRRMGITALNFSGRIDEVSIWSQVLSEFSISSIYERGLTGSETGLLAYYKFDHGTAGGDNRGINTLTDATANANDSKLVNFDLISIASNWVSGYTAPVPSNVAVTPPALGGGTSADPYQIATLENLYWLSQNSSVWTGKYFKQTSDIDLAAISNWMPIGSGFVPFSGTYDGGGYTIRNLTINSALTYRGLFGYASDGSVLKNLTLENANVTTTGNYASILAAFARGTISNCHTRGGTLTAGKYVGAMCGYGIVTIEDCSNSASVVSSGGMAGGIVGELQYGIIKRCGNSGTINSSQGFVGGVVGYTGSGTTVSANCTISDCYNTASISVQYYSGGIIGYNLGVNMYRCYSVGEVTGTYGGGASGGLVGWCNADYYNSISDSYCLQSPAIGYYSTTTYTTVTNVSTKTANQLQTQSTFSGWDFVNETTNGTADSWAITPNFNSGYPTLGNITATCTNGVVDLSRQPSGNVYTWYKVNGTKLTEWTDYIVEDGKTKFIKHPGSKVYCTVTNATFPTWIARTGAITVDKVVDLGPYISFVSEKTGNLSFYLQMSPQGKAYIDWGDGKIVVFDVKNVTTNISTTSYNKNSTVKIYGNNIYNAGLQDALITALDVSKYPDLKALTCANNILLTLDLSKNTNLRDLDCGWNKLSTLDLSNCTSLNTLYCYRNQFTFASLPQPKYSTYYFSPQANLAATCTGGIVDLSSQLTAKDGSDQTQPTVYTWYNADNTELVKGTDYDGKDGQFYFMKQPASTVYCNMTNAAFPDLTLRTTDITVDAVLTPEITFAAASYTGSFSFRVATTENTTIYVDKGDGERKAYTINTGSTPIQVDSYSAGNTVKIFSDKIKELFFPIEKSYVTALDVSKSSTLQLLLCSFQLLNVQTLPQPKPSYSMYMYAPQSNFAAVCTDGIVDLSSQLTAKDVNDQTQTTVYTWYNANGSELVKGVDYEGKDGKFYFIKQPASTVYCKMYNAAFPELWGFNSFRTTDITVDKVLVQSITYISENTTCSFDLKVSAPSNVYFDANDGNLQAFNLIGTVSGTIGVPVKIFGDNISYFDCQFQNLTNLNVNNNPGLEFLCCTDNKLTSLDVSKNTALRALSCERNQLSFATLPQKKAAYTTYTYAPQARFTTTCTNGVVDLSSQLTAKDINDQTQTTVYTWFKADGTALTANVDYIEENGVFTFIKMPATAVYCQMYNAAFPNLSGEKAFSTVDITVDAVLEPSISFVSNNTGYLSFSTALQEAGKVYVDWGNGILVPNSLTTSEATITTTNYTAGSTVKIYGNNIDRFLAPNSGMNALNINKVLPSTEIVCFSNNLNFGSLPVNDPQYGSYAYSPQNKHTVTCVNGVVDLTSQLTAMSFLGELKPTVYSWFLANGEALTAGADYIEEAGVFRFVKMPTQAVYCTMTNAAFPGLTLRTVDMTIDAVAEPNITFVSEENGDLKVLTKVLTGANIFVDWGDGSIIEYNTTDIWNNPSTTSYQTGSHVKIYSDKIIEINISYLSITDLEIHDAPELLELLCNNNKITSLSVSKAPKLKSLWCFVNQLTFATLPQPKFKTYLYGSQANLPATCTNGVVDLSSQLTATDIDGNPQTTSYTCFKTDNGLPLAEGADYMVNQGKIYFLTVPTSDVYCNLTNPAFPALTLRTADFTVDRPAVLPEPTFTFASEKDGNLAFSIASNSPNNSTAYIDWGDGKIVPHLFFNILSRISTTSYVAGQTVKIYADDISKLDISLQGITNLDVSKCNTLEKLDCSQNNLTALNVANNTELSILNCYINNLGALDVKNNIKLQYLRCFNNADLSELNLRNNTVLSYLNVSECALSSLDVSYNTALKELYLAMNQIATLDIRQHTALTGLGCNKNRLTTLDVSQNTLLTTLFVEENLMNFATLPQPEASFMSEYQYAPQAKLAAACTNGVVDLSSQLTAVDVDGNTQTTSYVWYNADGNIFLNNYMAENGVFYFVLEPGTVVYCEMTNPAFIGLTLRTENIILDTKATLPEPTISFVSENSGSLNISVDVAENSTVYVDWGNGILVSNQAIAASMNEVSTANYMANSSVKVYNSQLVGFYANEQGLTAINTQNAPKLVTLECQENKLEEIDLSNNVKLSKLKLYQNKLDNLDVSLLKELTNFGCSSNNLSTLDIQYNTKLRRLYCEFNNLSTLDISHNPELDELFCYNNKLTFSSLPQVDFVYFSYAPQANLLATCTNGVVDLSSQLTAVDKEGTTQTTVYSWYLADGTPLVKGVDYSEGNGVFFFTQLPASSVYCVMTNTAFPSLTLGTEPIAIDDVVKPSVTFTSNKSGDLSFKVTTATTPWTLQVDWGDGNLVSYVVNAQLTNILTSLYSMGSNVKVFGDGIISLDLYEREIEMFDVSNCLELKYLNVKSNNISSLNLSENTKLEFLYCWSNSLSTLDLSNNTDLIVLTLDNNQLAFKSLPQVRSSYSHYSYAPQANLNVTCSNGKVDLSSQRTAIDASGNTQTTVYTWYKTDETALIPDIHYWELNGVFIFQNVPNEQVYCTMTNAAFPALTLRTENITIDAEASGPNVWHGAVNTDWHTAENWSNGVPSTIDYIEIPSTASNQPVISSNVNASFLSIGSGAQVTIAPNGSLRVYQSLINNRGTEGLVIKSDATGTGKLLYDKAGVQATVEQYIVKDQWHYITSPVVEALNVNPLFKNFYAVSHTEAQSEGNNNGNCWNYLYTGDQIVAGTGYGVQYNRKDTDNDTIVTFRGELVGPEYVIATKYTGSNFGWNLLGNPYPCTISWTHTQKSNIKDAVYVYDPATSNYMSYVNGAGSNGGSEFLAPMQGFFVRAKSPNATLNINFDSKRENESSFKGATMQSLIRLSATDAEGRKDESLVRWEPTATAQFDDAFDAYKLKATASTTPQLYSVLNGDEYSINSLPEATVNTVIPFELMVKTTGTQQIAATELTGLDATLDVVLEDLQTGARTLLANSAYRFSATAGETRKFNLLFADATSVGRVEARTIKAYGAESRMCISNMSDGRNIVAVYNLNGQLVHQANAEGSYTEVELSNGLYVVKVTPENGNVFNGKVRIGSFK